MAQARPIGGGDGAFERAEVFEKDGLAQEGRAGGVALGQGVQEGACAACQNVAGGGGRGCGEKAGEAGVEKLPVGKDGVVVHGVGLGVRGGRERDAGGLAHGDGVAEGLGLTQEGEEGEPEEERDGRRRGEEPTGAAVGPGQGVACGTGALGGLGGEGEGGEGA